MRRVLQMATACAALLLGGTAHAQPYLPIETFYGLLNQNEVAARRNLVKIRSAWRNEYAAPLLELIGFVPSRATQVGIAELLVQASGRRGLDEWYEWLWSFDPGVHPDYAEFKAGLYEQIDPRFREYFDKRPTALIRLDEIRWGGVHRDGIPPLKNPKMIRAREARYLADGDVVFGVAIDGDVRAYPKRILAWHEMVKDTIAGRPLNGVYCTLCGAMILYDVTVNGVHHELGTSGFLYRSNKLMYDHATKSLWSTFEGAPVVGPLAGKAIELKTLYVVTTTWKEWKKRHPQTWVLSLDTGYQRNYSEGAAYREYFATDQLMFGVPKLDTRLSNKAEVLALRSGKEQLAIAADFLSANRLYHDKLAGNPLVVLTDASGANRVYESEDFRFTAWDGESALQDAQGRKWKVSEDQLTGPKTLRRLPAHRAFWFGWYSAYPDTRLVK